MDAGLIAASVTWRTVVRVGGALLLVATLLTIVGVQPARADFGDWEGWAKIEGSRFGWTYTYIFTEESHANTVEEAHPIDVVATYDLLTPNSDCFIHARGSANSGTGSFVIAWQPGAEFVGVSLVPHDVPATIVSEYGGPIELGCEQKTETIASQVSSFAAGAFAPVDPLQEAVLYSETPPTEGGYQITSFGLTRSVCTGYDTDRDGASDCDEVKTFGTDPTDEESVPSAPPGQSRITPTNTTCDHFANGTAATLQAARYSLKGNKIQQVDPGVLFYWVRVANAGTYTITQTLSPNTVTKLFPIASGSFAYDAQCVKQSAKPGQDAAGAVTIAAPGPGYIGIKYKASSLAGQPTPNPSTLRYEFATTGVAGSSKGLDVNKKG